MSEFNNRDVLRAILKGDTNRLHEHFEAGLSPSLTTENESWNLLHQATILAGRKTPIASLGLLISNGVDVNALDAYGNTPLHYAARNRDCEAISCLLDAGAEPNVLNNEGISPLHQSVLTMPLQLEATELLLEAGASPGLGTAISYAQSLGDPDVDKLFAKYASQA